MSNNELLEKRKALLAKRIKEAEMQKKVDMISERPLEFSIPLSFSQQRFWFMEQWEPGKATYNITQSLFIKGNLDLKLMEKAFNEIIKRHEILHMVYQDNNEDPKLTIVEDAKIQIEFIHLNKKNITLSEADIKKHINRQINIPFNLTSELPIRVKLLQVADNEYVLIVNLHHIAGDAWSMGILFSEFVTLYSSYITGNEAVLQNLSIQFSDYAYWQKNILNSETYDNQLKYWKKVFEEEVPLLELPTDRPRPAIKTTNGKAHFFTISNKLAEDIRLFVKDENITMFMFLMAGLQILLQYYTNQEDITVGTTIAGRNRSELETLIGPFINTLVLRNNLSGNPSVREFLQEVKDISLNAFSNQDIPFEKLVEEIKPPRTLDHTPLFQVMMTFHNAPQTKVKLPELEITQTGFNTETAKFDLNFSFLDDGSTIHGDLTYNTDLFNLETIERMVEHYMNVLDEMIKSPDKLIHCLTILSNTEYSEIVLNLNQEQIEYPKYEGIHQLFERQAQLVANEIAVVFENQKITYRQLNERANQLAHYLRDIGIKPETKIAIFMDRSIDLVVSILGVLKAGGAFVPLDPIYPSDRVKFILKDLEIPVIITQEEYEEDFKDSSVSILTFENCEETFSKFSVENIKNITSTNNLMYVLYTSGSTGKPKGVGVEHRNCFNYIFGLMNRLDLNERLSYAIVSTFAADLGAAMLWGALATGGELHIISYERASDPVLFKEYWCKNKIDVIKIVPSHYEMLQGEIFSDDILPQKYLIFAGEASHWSMIEKIRKLNPKCSIQNHYGPTETVVSTLTYSIDLEKEPPETFAVPLGKPIPNTRAYIFNQYVQPVPIGVKGELYIGGLGVSRGYLNRSDLTNERFIQYQFDSESKQRLYRTGDRVRFLKDGNIEFLERVDHQVKIRGFRVELGEIENMLKTCAEIRDCVVVAREDKPGDKRLVAYLIVKERNEYTILLNEIREYLRNHLPDYMIPSAFMLLEKLPLTSNGKVDRTQLPEPEMMKRDINNNYTPPQNELQEKIASIWAEILGVENIGIDENFFDLGGESFKAVRVVRKIDPSLSVVSIFKKPTIRGLAEILGANGGTNHEILVQLTKPIPQNQRIASLVCVPYGGGSAVSYQPLADALPKGLSLFAVEIPGHDISRPDEPLRPLVEVAQECVDELLKKVHGPIALYGHCLGGALALEIARKLEQQNCEVIGVFQAGTFPSPRLPGKWFDLWAKILPADRWTSNLAYQDMLKSLGGMIDEMDKKEKDHFIHSIRHDFREAEDYYTKLYADLPQKLNAPITSIVGEKDRTTEFYEERHHEWEHFSKTVNLKVIPHSGHYFHKHQSVELANIISNEISGWIDADTKISNVASEMYDRIELQVHEDKNKFTYQKPSMLVFLMVAFGQLISMIGTSLTSFSMGIWIYQQSGAVTDFALIGVATSLPGILALPIAGALADRYDRRKIMLLCDVVCALSISAAAILLWTNRIELWHVYIISSVGSIANAFQRPSYLAAITQLVPKKYLGHANGIVQLATSTATMLAPVLGGILIIWVGLSNIFILDFITYVFAIVTLLCIRFPNTMFRKLEEPILKEVVGGWNYIMKRKSLVAMVVFFIIFNFLFSMTTSLLTPLVLTFESSKALGWVTGAAGFGGLLGSIVMSLWGGTKRRADGMVGFVILTGLSFILLGWKTDILTCVIGALGVWMSLSLINAHWQSLIQVKVGLELQGRIFAINQTLAWSCMPLGYLLIGPLIDKVFEPLMLKGHTLANIFGGIIGVGNGRGMGLMMVISGVILAICGYLGLKYKPLRFMEDILPDAVPDIIILDDKDAIQEQADQLIASI